MWWIIVILWVIVGVINIFGDKRYVLEKPKYAALWIVAILSMVCNALG
jgi:hypothetical protein